jgi:tRNA A37 N6-isopentenylltransferase MiaA
MGAVGDGRFMAKQSQRKFAKRQKEFERMRKAKEKMDRRQGKADEKKEAETAEKIDTVETSEQS